MRDKRSRILLLVFLLLVTILAFVFRFGGIRYGLPTAERQYSIHPDEFLIVETAFDAARSFSLDVGFYNYPSLLIDLSGIFMMFGITFGGNELADLYLYARYAAALLGSLAVPVVCLAGAKQFGVREGVIAALALALAPLHLMHSHFAAVDAPSTLFVALTVLASAYIIKKPSAGAAVLAGAASGLAAGCKYNCALVFLCCAAALWLSEDSLARKLKLLLFAALAAAAAFLLTTPGVLVNFEGVSKAIRYEMAHTASGHSNVFEGLGSPFVFNIGFNLFTGFGSVTCFIAVAGLVLGLVRKNKYILMTAAFVVPYYILMSLSKVNFSRYMLPLYPCLALYVGYALGSLFGQGSKERTYKLFVYAVVMLFGICIIMPARQAYGVFDRVTPQDAAGKYVRTDVRGTIGVIDYPWFYSPAYTKMCGYGTLPLRKEEFDKADMLTMLSSEDMPETVVISDYEFYDTLRLWEPSRVAENYKKLLSGMRLDYKGDDRVMELLDIISSRYKLEKTFSCGKDITLMSCPHDMCYVNPQIYVFRKNSEH